MPPLRTKIGRTVPEEKTAPGIEHVAPTSPAFFPTTSPTLGSQSVQTKNEGPLETHRQSLRVTYSETDGQRRVHHANYLNYFERGRVEMLRAMGISYKQLEESGLMLVVTEMNVRYQAAAEFDDLLDLTTELVEVRKVRIRHHYRIERQGELIVAADSVIACIGSDGAPRRLPIEILPPKRGGAN